MYEQRIEQLKQITSKKNWDGYNANPIDSSLWDIAKTLRPIIPETFDVFPDPTGGVVFETAFKDEHWEEIDIKDNYFCYCNSDDVEKEYTDINEFIKFIKELIVNKKLNEIEKDFK